MTHKNTTLQNNIPPKPIGTFTISELSIINLNDIDGYDSILISDWDTKTRKWYTKRLTVSRLVDFITRKDTAISSLIDNMILKSAEPGGTLQPIIDNSVCATVDTTLTENITTYAPIQKWYNQGIENEGSDFILNGGDSGSSLSD